MFKRYHEIEKARNTKIRRGPRKQFHVTIKLDCHRQKGFCAICQRAKLTNAPVIIKPDFTIKDCPACVEHYLTHAGLGMKAKIIKVEVMK